MYIYCIRLQINKDVCLSVCLSVCKKNNISRGIEEFVRVVIMSSCSGTILSISCDLREIQKRYCKLYLGIKIYRQSSRIIFGAHVARSLLWNTLTILHTSCAASLSFAEFVELLCQLCCRRGRHLR